MEQFKNIALSDIHLSKTNPRKHFDKKQMEDLRKSIEEKGIVVPLLVRINSKQEIEVVAGERRYRCALELKLKEIPCLVQDMTDEQALEIQVIENLQREDVHPLDEAEGFAKLLETGKHTAEEIAGKVGKSVSWIYQVLKLNDLLPELKKKFFDGALNRTQALMLCRLPADIQKAVIKSGVQHYGEISTGYLKEAINRHYLDLHKGPFKKDDATLLPEAGACIACPKRTGFSPALFPELSKKDMCLDHECFNKKLKAFAKQKLEELEERGVKAVAVEGVYSPDIETDTAKEVLKRIDYEEVKGNGKKKKPGQVEAVIVSDDDPQRIGKTISIIPREKDSTDGGGGHKVKRPSKAELFKRKIEREAVNRIIQQILIKVNAPTIPQKLFAHLVEDIASGYMSNGTVEFYKQYLGYSDLKAYSANNALDKRIHNPKTPIGELHKIALTGLIFKRFQSDVADEYAELLKIDTAGIRKKVKEEFEAAKKAKEAVQKPVKKSAKRKAVKKPAKKGKKK